MMGCYEILFKFQQGYIIMTYLGIVTHFVFGSWVVIAFSSSSKPLFFFNFFTKLLTAFSQYLSSPSPFFHPSSFLTMGGVKGNREVIIGILLVRHGMLLCHKVNTLELKKQLFVYSIVISKIFKWVQYRKINRKRQDGGNFSVQI